MMAAAVSQVAERIVLAKNTKNRSALAMTVDSAECGLKTAHTHLYLKPVFLQVIGQKAAGKYLFALVLRIIKNLVCHGAQLSALRVNGFKQRLFITHFLYSLSTSLTSVRN